MNKSLPSSFFNRSTLTVARELIGCYLVREQKGKIERYMITETEAYDGPKDLASHASKGRTKRTEIMFGHPGNIYIYLVYGMHWMFNIVTGPKDYPAAVLIRGLEGLKGPGILTKKLNITGKINNKILSPKNKIWIERPETLTRPHKIKRTPRIGVDYSGPIWSKKKWRFILIKND